MISRMPTEEKDDMGANAGCVPLAGLKIDDDRATQASFYAIGTSASSAGAGVISGCSSSRLLLLRLLLLHPNYRRRRRLP